jgi:hypothetical protein
VGEAFAACHRHSSASARCSSTLRPSTSPKEAFQLSDRPLHLLDCDCPRSDFYTQIRLPRESCRTLEAVRPQLAEFELRCDIGDYDIAATILQDIDFEYLRVGATTAPWSTCMGVSMGGSPNPTFTRPT